VTHGKKVKNSNKEGIAMTPHSHYRFHVELLMNPQSLLLEPVLVEENTADGERDVEDVALRRSGEFPTPHWTRIDPWHVEEIH
jgi:hypothetical protein